MIYKLITFPLMWIFPSVVNAMARRVVTRHGNGTFYNDEKIDITWQGAYIDICKYEDGKLVPVRSYDPITNNSWIDRGWWLLDLWRAA